MNIDYLQLQIENLNNQGEEKKPKAVITKIDDTVPAAEAGGHIANDETSTIVCKFHRDRRPFCAAFRGFRGNKESSCRKHVRLTIFPHTRTMQHVCQQ